MEIKLQPDSKEKIYNTLRSLFRYQKLIEMNAPQILFENEGRMISKRVRAMSAEEIFLAITSWDEFQKEQVVQDEIQNQKLTEDLDAYYQTMN